MGSIVVLSGAGISAESGIQTFRGSDGLWEDHRIEEVATPEAFATNPTLVQRFYNARRQQLLSNEVTENTAHLALARLQQEHSAAVTIVTQNVDDLHERAGSLDVLHMHGELLKSRCSHCDDIQPCDSDLSIEDQCRDCNRTGTIRPHIVWFGEMPFYMEEISTALAQCELFITVGTSGNVYPAAGFAQIAAQGGAKIVELNLEASNTPGTMDETRLGRATDIVPAFVNELLR
ncbi:MAG: Sir2 family NAD+-dependent deacetylase [Pseudomonadota bacterium]